MLGLLGEVNGSWQILSGDPLWCGLRVWMVKVIGELIESIAGRAGLKNVREFGQEA